MPLLKSENLRAKCVVVQYDTLVILNWLHSLIEEKNKSASLDYLIKFPRVKVVHSEDLYKLTQL